MENSIVHGRTYSMLRK